MLLLAETKLDSEKLLEPQMLETNQKIKNFNQAPVSGSIQVHLSLQVSVINLGSDTLGNPIFQKGWQN